MDINKILEMQSRVYKEILNNNLSTAKNEGDVYSAHSSAFKEFYSRAFKSMVDEETIRDLDSKKMDELMLKIANDLAITHGQASSISNKISNSYNSNQDYKTSLRNRVQYLTNIMSDADIMLEKSESDAVVFKDSFTNYEFIDKDYGSGTIANISTGEGIATLSMTEDDNLSVKITDVKISGNGEAGNYHVVKKIEVDTSSDDFNTNIKEKSLEDPKDDTLAIGDSEPSTWFEYQKLGLTEEDRKEYNLTWGKADRVRDDLTLRITIELESVSDVNWIDITPYMPEKDNNPVILYSASISEDGSNYSPIFEEDNIVYENLNIISQGDTDSAVLSENSLKLMSQGILSFPTSRAKYIEIILKQVSPYSELLGTEYYMEIIESNGELESSKIIDKDSVPKAIQDSPPGKYKIE